MNTDDMEWFTNAAQSVTGVFINTVVDSEQLQLRILDHLQAFAESPKQWPDYFPRGKMVSELDDMINEILAGAVIIVHQQLNQGAIAVPLWQTKTRSISEPKNEKIIIGPQESFIEDISTNIGLMRRWIRDPELKIEYRMVGVRSQTRVAICYINDIAKSDWIDEIEQSIKSLDIDIITGHTDLLDHMLQSNQTTFPMYQLTEIPSRCQYELSIGRIAIFVDGSPYAVLLPTPLMSLMRGGEYLFQSNYVQLFTRFLRIVASIISMYASSIYIALVSVNTSIFPILFSLSISTDQQELPYTSLFETLIILVVLDIFIEGTTYVPGNIGPALNIVGSLILGQAATQAGLISSFIVIITAITAVGTYLSTVQLAYAIRLWKYAFVISAGVFGIFGIVCCGAIQLAHLCRLKSLGVPYLSPFTPFSLRGLLNDGIYDPPVQERFKRPRIFHPRDIIRQKRRK